jgi:hypothetical protein
MKIEHELSTKSLKDLIWSWNFYKLIFKIVVKTKQKPLKPSKENAKTNAKNWLVKQKTKP